MDLWSEKATAQFDASFGKTGIATGLDQLLFNVQEPFRLAISDLAAAGVPWEAFQRVLHARNRRKFAPIRLLDTDPGFAFSAVPDRMRILALVGDPGESHDFDPQDAEAFFRDAVLAAGTQQESFLDEDPLVVTQLRQSSMSDAASLATRHRPNVVIYFGHGRHENGPQLCLDPGDSGWRRLSEVADALFPAPAPRPPLWIFWACSLAEDTVQPMLTIEGPGVFTSLGPRGAVSLLAMRSKVRVWTAKIMLEALIQALVAGEPLDVAAALARAAVLAVEHETTDHMDFAAPAVWSTSEPVDRLTWGASAAFPPSWVLMPLLGGPDDKTPALATGVCPLDERYRDVARIWAQPGRHFIVLPAPAEDSPTIEATFYAMGAAIRQLTGRPIVPVLLPKGGGFDRRLRFWAQRAHAQLDPRHHDRAIAAAVKSIADDGSYGLQRLFAIPGLVVMISEPPDQSAQWDVLREVDRQTTLILMGTAVPTQAVQWPSDGLPDDAVSDRKLIDAALARAPASMAVLAVVERPMTLAEVARETSEDLESVPDIHMLLIRIGARRILGQTARADVLAQLDKQAVIGARRRCVTLLNRQDALHDFGATAEVARHLLALDDGESAAKALEAGFTAAGATWTQAERYELFRMAAASQPLRDGLPAGMLVVLADAGVSAQDTALARVVLDSFVASEPSDRATRHALLSETYKSDPTLRGAHSLMRDHAEKAVKASIEASEGKPDPLSKKLATAPFRVNLARITQYFDHNYKAAKAEHLEVMAELEADADRNREAADVYAAAGRNAAECVLDPATRPIATPVRDEIEGLLEKADKIATRHALRSTQADLLYTYARAAEAAGDISSALAYLERIYQNDWAKDFPVIAAVARDRSTWLEVSAGRRQFSLDELRLRLRPLDLLNFHAWAARVAIKSRTRGAKALFSRGTGFGVEHARELLIQARDSIDAHPALSSRSDDLRAARLFAGLQAVVGGSFWAEFVASSAGRRLSDSRALRDPQDYWNEVN